MDLTYQLLLDYSLFRLSTSSVSELKLKKYYPLAKPDILKQHLRFLGHKYAAQLKCWPRLTDKLDFSVFLYDEFRAIVSSAFEKTTKIDAMFIFMYFELVSVMVIFSVSTNINGDNVQEICQFASAYFHSSTKVQDFLFHSEHGWYTFLTAEYTKAKEQQKDTFEYWLDVIKQEAL